MKQTQVNKTDIINHEHKDTFTVPTIFPLITENCRNSVKNIEVPGSKSITNRALLLSTLADGESILRSALFSDDSRHFLKCIQELGFSTLVDEEKKTIHIKGQAGTIPKQEASLYVGSAGTAARFLTALLALSHGIYHMDASAQMRKRPMAPLLNSLSELGCEITYPLSNSNEGFFPFTLHANGFQNHEITIDIDQSSQFLSALLITACLSKDDFTIHIKGSHGMSYINMTCRMLKQFGVTVESLADRTYFISKNQHLTALDYQIEPDVSAACYFYAMAPLLQIPIRVNNVHFDSLQGDVAFLRILEQMGCEAIDEKEGILLLPPSGNSFHGITVDMSACSDQAITLAAIAVFADTPTTITGIGHIRYQESDRIHAITTELHKMGITCTETADSITIFPAIPSPSLVETYDDHRMAMGFSLIGLRSEGIVINNPACCRKTFENYFTVLSQTVADIIAH